MTELALLPTCLAVCGASPTAGASGKDRVGGRSREDPPACLLAGTNDTVGHAYHTADLFTYGRIFIYYVSMFLFWEKQRIADKALHRKKLSNSPRYIKGFFFFFK